MLLRKISDFCRASGDSVQLFKQKTAVEAPYALAFRRVRSKRPGRAFPFVQSEGFAACGAAQNRPKLGKIGGSSFACTVSCVFGLQEESSRTSAILRFRAAGGRRGWAAWPNRENGRIPGARHSAFLSYRPCVATVGALEPAPGAPAVPGYRPCVAAVRALEPLHRSCA